MINKDQLLKKVEEGLVSVQKHPLFPLYIYNYTPKVQYERLWDEVTRKTRGLILDEDGNIVARPFGKFFNLEEHSSDEIPSLPFEVYEKLDGSLGILYWFDNIPWIATRGSFMSDQAQHATKLLHRAYSHLLDALDKDKTYLFEIIYPENRIVVDYGAIDDLYLITVVDNATGEGSFHNPGFPEVKRYDGINDITKLKALEWDNSEGFVVKFSNNFRVKVKFSEYVRLHRIITNVSSTTIWEHLKDGLPMDELLDKVPDEFYGWVKKEINKLEEAYSDIEIEALRAYQEFPTRKESALYFQKQTHPSILFAMLDKKPYDQIIYKLIKPKYSKPFKTAEC